MLQLKLHIYTEWRITIAEGKLMKELLQGTGSYEGAEKFLVEY